MPMSESNPPAESTKHEPGTISGKWVVIAMFTFAIAITATLWIFWKLHVGPFLPLQQALAAEFEDSRPRVEGGQRKIHQGSPKILRITMKVEFDPTKDKPAAEAFANRVESFVRDVFELQAYEILELHFYWPDPEKTIKAITIERKVDEGRAKN